MDKIRIHIVAGKKGPTKSAKIACTNPNDHGQGPFKWEKEPIKMTEKKEAK